MQDLQTIDTQTLSTVAGGLSIKLPFQMPQLPWWVTGERFKIPAADPPGHTAERRQMQR
jgi:hypothetical protein